MFQRCGGCRSSGYKATESQFPELSVFSVVRGGDMCNVRSIDSYGKLSFGAAES